MAVAYLFTKKITMSNKELVETAKQAMKDLSAGNNMLEHEQTAYNCLRLFCERVEQTKELQSVIGQIKAYANENIAAGEPETYGDWHKQYGILISNKQALDIAKFVPLYHD